MAQAAQYLPSYSYKTEQETPILAVNVCGDAKAFSMGRALVPRSTGVLTFENSAAP